MGIPISSTVLQRVGEEGLGNPRRGRSNYGGHSSFLERRGVARDFEVGASVRPSSFHGFVNLILSTVSNSDPYLARFRGKPGQLSPKARLLMLAGWLLQFCLKYVPILFFHSTLIHFLIFELAPNSTEPLFNRHDWIVQRQAKKSDTLSTTIPLLSPTAVPCSVSTFGRPSTASRVFKPVPMVGSRFGVMLR